MKKVFSILAVAALSLSIVACGGEEKKDEKKDKKKTEEAPKEEEKPVEEPVVEEPVANEGDSLATDAENGGEDHTDHGDGHGEEH